MQQVELYAGFRGGQGGSQKFNEREQAIQAGAARSSSTCGGCDFAFSRFAWLCEEQIGGCAVTLAEQ